MYTVYDYADRFIQKNKIDALPVDIKHIAKSLGNSVQRYSQGKKFIKTRGAAKDRPRIRAHRNAYGGRFWA